MNNNNEIFLTRIRNFYSSLPKSVMIGGESDIINGDLSEEILPFELYRVKRENISRIGDQINKSFFFEIFDGCAVLMRRMIEMLLILSFKYHGIEKEIITKEGNYLQLSEIIKIANNNTKLDLTRNSKDYLELLKEQGNLSAHNPFHNARRKDLLNFQPKFRHLIEELLYKAGINK